MITELIKEFARPGGSTTPHHRGATFAWHSLLGGMIALPFILIAGAAWGGLFPVAMVFAVYWLAKEYRDLTRGGDARDGLEDAIAVAMGAGGASWIYAASGMVALLIFSAICVIVSIAAAAAMLHEIRKGSQ